ncbi:MAG: NAD(P)-dependent alcohol dehydrogenase [Gemmatimonadales bacterium]|jgi:NADPH:quinone reductase-like Zn-dependent oxidoreductase
MKAIVQDTYGSPDVLKLEDIDKPLIGDDDLLVRVHAAGVDRGVWHIMTGLPYLIRIMGYGFRGPKTRVPGTDVAGCVEAVGTNVTQWQVGEEVFGTCEGAFAEYACVKHDKCVPKPANVTFEQAAAVPVSGITALQGVRDQGAVAAGQSVLVIGASGGVGTFAVQIAKALGAEVTGVCSTSKVDLVRSIGADHVIDYTREDVAETERRYDVILDIGGNRPLSHLRRALAPRGRLVMVGGEHGDRWIGGMARPLRALVLSRFVSQKMGMFIAQVRQKDLLYLKDLIETGKVMPVIDNIYSLAEAAEAIRHLEAGQARGKVVVRIVE